jgi:hypothetical protein
MSFFGIKAIGILAFLRRNLNKCSKEVKEKAYTTLIRPNLEYGSSVWDPFRQYQIDAVEMVQRRAARFEAVTVLSSCRSCWSYDIGWYLESVDVVCAFVEVYQSLFLSSLL